jgi:hypothetical protein
MKTVLDEIRHAIANDELDWDIEGSSVLIRFKTGRQQRVTLSLEGETYVLESIVLAKKDRPDDLSPRDLIARAWRRNAHTEIVAFGLDRREKLVGKVRVPAKSIQRHARTYFELLAIECDRFEYVLTGADASS